MKQREVAARSLCFQQLAVCGLYFVQSRLAQGLAGFFEAVAGAAAVQSTRASSAAAQAIVLSAARRSAAVGVECIDVHLRVRRAVGRRVVWGGGAGLPAPSRPLADQRR